MTIRATIIVTGFALILACAPPQAPDDLNSSVAALVDRYAENGDFSGIVAVSRAGELVAEHAIGYLRWGETAAPTLDDTFHIASISKTFTAAAIRELAESGALSLEDPLSRFLPDFPAAEEITFIHLLRHESGIPDYWTQPGVFDFASRPVSLDELIAWIGEMPLDFAPGTRSSYSNSGYALLAAVIEAASGRGYYEQLAEHVIGPAGLTDTTQYALDADASGYQPAFGHPGLAPHVTYDPSILVGSGSLKSSARDLLAWCSEFNADFNDPATQPFIYGWGARQARGLRWVEQTGRNPGFASHLRAYPDQELCVVVLSNIESEAVSEIGSGVADLAFGRRTSLPQLRPTYAASAEQLADYIGTYDAGPGNVLEIRQTNEGLELRGGQGVYLPMEPIGDGRFFYRQLYVEIVGQRDESGEISALLWGGDYPLARIQGE